MSLVCGRNNLLSNVRLGEAFSFEMNNCLQIINPSENEYPKSHSSH